jgi:hypothetical protein
LCSDSPATQWRQIGLSQSKRKCDIQLAALTIGGPVPLTA